MKKTLAGLIAWVLLSVLVPAHAQVTTAQYDNARTGANINETILTPQSVSPQQFGKLFSLPVDGSVYAQPLYLPGVEIPGKGKHNVVYIATEHDSVYAFDADGKSLEPLWHVSFIRPEDGITTVPAKDVGRPCLSPEVGITATPVIDLSTGTLYVVARTKERQGLFEKDEYVQHLHALAVTTGAQKFGGPVVIHASVPGSGTGSTQGKLDFDPLRHNPRTALLLANGTVFIGWGSSCDARPYHGWVMAYDAQSLKQKGVFNVSPDAGEGGIWQSDAGLAADAEGNVYVVTGNGKFDAAANGRNFGNSVLKLGLDEQGLAVRDYFTPFNHDDLNTNDEDLGSGGPVLLPEPAAREKKSLPRRLLAMAGKGGTLYLIDREKMGKFHPGDDSHAVHTLTTDFMGFGAPATWNGNLYHLFGNHVLSHYMIEKGKLVRKATAQGPKFMVPGATPTISANGTKNGIVWVAEWRGWKPTDPPSVLHAYDASNVAHELFNSEQKGERDRLSRILRFAVPTVANGRVYVGGAKQVDVFGPLSLAARK